MNIIQFPTKDLIDRDQIPLPSRPNFFPHITPEEKKIIFDLARQEVLAQGSANDFEVCRKIQIEVEKLRNWINLVTTNIRQETSMKFKINRVIDETQTQIQYLFLITKHHLPGGPQITVGLHQEEKQINL